MMLRDHLETTGQTLFRRRSWLPLLVLVAIPSDFAGLRYPLNQHSVQEVWTCLCFAVAAAGQLLRFITIAHAPSRTSGRNRQAQVADVLNTDGTYSIVRNPLYLGNCLTWLGLAAVPRSPWPWIAVALIFWLYHERVILAEEAFLAERFGGEYRAWAAATPAFLPSFSHWRSPRLKFSFRAALGREYINVFATISAFAAFDTIADSIAERHAHIDTGWAIAWGAAFVFFLVVRFMKKRTRLLEVPNRD